MRVLELFSGYGSQALALEYLGIEFTSDISEIDKYAIEAYNQIHGETHNWGDITKIDETKLPYYDLITYSSPCQDFSVAGLGKGGDEGSGTRSSLLWECERIIRAVKPKYLLMENVKNLVGKKHKHNFVRWLNTLEMMGYQNYWQVLNAKDYGVPQNRERVFVVSILGAGQYMFPNKIPLTKRLKDILEPAVDEKYYLSDKYIQYIQDKDKKDYNFRVEISNSDNIRKTPIKARGDLAFISEPLALDEQNQYIRKDGIVGTLTTDGSSPKHNNRVIEPLHIKEATQKGYSEAYEGDSVSLDQPNSKTRRGRVGHQMANTLTCACNQGVVMQEPYNLYPNSGNPQAGRVYNAERISPAMDTCSGGNRMPKITEQYRIRKLTPRECWRLMGVKDETFDKVHDISNSQLYKMAGNSIVVDVLMGIFNNLFLENDTKGQMSLI